MARSRVVCKNASSDNVNKVGTPRGSVDGHRSVPQVLRAQGARSTVFFLLKGILVFPMGRILLHLPKRCRSAGRRDRGQIQVCEGMMTFSSCPGVHHRNVREVAGAKGHACPIAVTQVRQVNVAAGISDLARVRSDNQSQKTDLGQGLFILRAQQQRVGSAESIVGKARQRAFMVDVATPECGLKIKR